MSNGTNGNGPDPSSDEPMFDPVRERERLLAGIQGASLNALQTELVCSMLAWLGELDVDRGTAVSSGRPR